MATADFRARQPRPAGPRQELLRSEEHTSELQSRLHLVCRLLLEKKKRASQHSLHFDLSERLHCTHTVLYGAARAMHTGPRLRIADAVAYSSDHAVSLVHMRDDRD